MTTEKLKNILTQIDDVIDFQLTWFQINKNLRIKANDYAENDWDQPEQTEVKHFDFVACFYGEIYEFGIKKEYIDNDEPGTTYISAEGNLLSSFEELIEGDVWDIIKTLCLKFSELVKQDNLQEI